MIKWWDLRRQIDGFLLNYLPWSRVVEWSLSAGDRKIPEFRNWGLFTLNFFDLSCLPLPIYFNRTPINLHPSRLTERWGIVSSNLRGGNPPFDPHPIPQQPPPSTANILHSKRMQRQHKLKLVLFTPCWMVYCSSLALFYVLNGIQWPYASCYVFH